MNSLIDALPVAAGEPEVSGTGPISTSFGTAEVAESARAIAPEIWRGTFAGEARDARYYEVIEETLPEKFDYRYLILRNTETGQTAVQPFFFVAQDLTDGLPGKIRRTVARVQRRFPRFLVMRVLMVGCAVGEGQVACSEPWAVQALHEALRVVARRSRASLIVFKDYPARHREALSLFSNDGYRRVPSMPAAKVDLDYKDFDDYMQRRLGKVFRKNLRRKFRASEEIGVPEMTVCEDVTGMIDEIYPLYRQTLARADFSFEELTPEFLARVGREMPDKARFFIWRLGGKIIAFNFCLLHEGVLHDMDIGLDYSVALDLHLYFVTWRDVFSWAIKNGVRTYYTAPLNYDPKLHLRLELAPLDLYICHTSRLINPAFRIAMSFLQPARHHPILREFPNAHEL
jgi:CelD/BcsL family acetyltransferase involved in cellulose biosynthesis